MQMHRVMGSGFYKVAADQVDHDDKQVVLLTLNDQVPTFELAYVLNTTDSMIWFCVIRPNCSGQNTFGVKLIPRSMVEATPLIGSGPKGLLHRWFVQDADEVAKHDPHAALHYKMDRVHDPQNRQLLERFLALSSADAIFALLTQSVASMGLGYGKHAVSRTAWAAALHWRDQIKRDCVLAARERILEAFLQRESPLQLAQRIIAHIGALADEEVFWLASIPLVALAWEVLQRYPDQASGAAYQSTAMALLEHALDLDLIFQRSPLFWAGVAPLPETEDGHFELIKESVILDFYRSGWHDVLRLRHVLSDYRQGTLGKIEPSEEARIRGESEAFRKIHLTEMDLSQIWVKKWEQAPEDGLLHVAECPWLTPFERAYIKDVLISRFTQLDALSITNFVHRQTGPWYKFFDDYDRQQVINILTWRLADEELAAYLDDLHQRYPLPPPIYELVQQRLAPPAPSAL